MSFCLCTSVSGLSGQVSHVFRNIGVERKPIQTCVRSDPLEVAVARLVSGGVGRLICVNSAGHLQGIISLSDVYRYFVDLGQEGLNMRPSRMGGQAEPLDLVMPGGGRGVRH